LLGCSLRRLLERDLDIQIYGHTSEISWFTGGFWYHGPVKIRVANHSHDLTYKFRFGESQLLVKRPVIPLLRFWRQVYRGGAARVIGGTPRGQLTDFSLAPLAVEEFLIEWDSLDFPEIDPTGIPRYAQSAFRTPMVGRIRRLERVIANLKFEPNQ